MVNNLLIKNNYIKSMFNNLRDSGCYVIDKTVDKDLYTVTKDGGHERVSDERLFYVVAGGKAYCMSLEFFNGSYDLRMLYGKDSEDYSRTDFEQASGTQKLALFMLDNNFIVVECSKLVQLAEITNFANFEDLVDYGCSLRHWLREATKEETN